MEYLLLALLALAPTAVAARPDPAPYCKRLAFDAEVPAGLVGKYNIVGGNSATGSSYSGTLQVSLGNNSYILTRTVQGRVRKGEAWVEVCSPDKFQRLMVRLDSKPRAIEFACYLRGDGDNFVRASCTTADARGLEAWFQRHDALAP